VLITLGLVVPNAAAAVPQTVINGLLHKAERAGSVKSVEAVETTLINARTARGSDQTAAGSPPATSQMVDLVVMHGQFVESDVPIPQGAKPPTGTIMAFTVRAGTQELDDLYVGDRAPTLAGLGAVQTETITQPAAITSRVRHVTARTSKLRRHTKARTATWSNNCKAAEGHHCYAIAYWPMSGGEQVQGTQAQIITTNMNVPEPSYQFVTNEVWTVFLVSGYWVESGQITGRGEGNCCTLFFFSAVNNGAGFEYRKGWQVTPNTWNNYGQKWVGGSTWCVTVGPHWEQQPMCYAGLPAYSKELQTGAEAFTETEPTNSGSVLPNAQFTNGYYYNWNKAFWFKNEHMCISGYPPGYPGDISFGTC
jgi:hypothetical protein